MACQNVLSIQILQSPALPLMCLHLDQGVHQCSGIESSEDEVHTVMVGADSVMVSCLSQETKSDLSLLVSCASPKLKRLDKARRALVDR